MGWWILCFGVSAFLIWWVGIRTAPQPASQPSLGFFLSHPRPPAPTALTGGTAAPLPKSEEPRGADGSAAGPASPTPAGCTPNARLDKHLSQAICRLVQVTPDAGLRFDMVVRVDPKHWWQGIFDDVCPDRALVDIVISGTEAFWNAHPELEEHATEFALGWDESTHPTAYSDATAHGPAAPVLVAPAIDHVAALHPLFYENGALKAKETELKPDLKAKTEKGPPLAAHGRVMDWGDTKAGGRRLPLHFRFRADWVVSRSVSSCYVRLPSLPANNRQGGEENALRALDYGAYEGPNGEQELKKAARPPTTSGRVTLATTGIVAADLSVPEPEDVDRVPAPEKADGNQEFAGEPETVAGSVWTCRPAIDLSFISKGSSGGAPPEESLSSNECGAVAVVTHRIGPQVQTLAVLLLGVVVGFILERLLGQVPAWVGSRFR